MNMKTYSVDTGLLRYASNKRFEKHVYVYNNLHAISCAAGCVSWEYEILRISEWSGISKRGIKESLRWLMKNGFVEKWGHKWHVKSKYTIREMVNYDESGQIPLTPDKIKISYVRWKANAYEYIKSVNEKIKRAKARSETLTPRRTSKGAQREFRPFYPSCSYRQAEVLTGRSKSYLHKQSLIQDVSRYETRWCPFFDRLNVRSLKRLNEYIDANEEVCPSMFKFDKQRKKWRRRRSDAIYPKFEIRFRKTPDKYKLSIV